MSVRIQLKWGKRDLWSPYLLTRSVLRGWWNADDHGTALMTDDGSGLISSWTDRMGYKALTAVTTARPTWSSTGMSTPGGNYAAVVYDGTTDWSGAANTTNLPAGATPSTSWAVATLISTGVLQIASVYGGTSNGTVARIQANSAGAAQISIGGTAFAVTGNTWTTPAIVGGIFSATTGTMRQNGSLIGVSAAGTLNVGTSVTRIASAMATPGGFWSGPIRQVLITTALSAAQISQVEGYLAWNCGMQSLLPDDHPYKGFPP